MMTANEVRILGLEVELNLLDVFHASLVDFPQTFHFLVTFV